LIAILDDDDTHYRSDTSDGWGPVHAVDLLAEIGAPEAIEPMLDAFHCTEWDTIVHDRIIGGLQRFGVAAIEPVLEAVAQTENVLDRAALCESLSKLGVRDERLYAVFCSVFDEDVISGALLFGAYGDPRALPLLEAAIEDLDPTFDGPLGPRDLIELDAAFHELGGVYSPALQARVDAWFAEAEARRRPAASPTVRAAAKVGRNDPCPCGSGKKHKKCCIGAGPTSP